MPPAAVLFNRGMSNPKLLDDLLGEARNYAEFMLRKAGSIPPTMFAQTPEGLLHFLPTSFDARTYEAFSLRNIGRVYPMLLTLSPEGQARVLPESFGDARSKEKFVSTCRLICAANGATTVVTILESWVTFAKEGTPPDDTPPSEAIDRKEFVILVGEATGRKAQVFLPIIRTGAGGFFGFGEFDSSRFDGFQGRFSEILPPKKPDKRAREMAQLVLTAMGVAKGFLRPKPGRN